MTMTKRWSLSKDSKKASLVDKASVSAAALPLFLQDWHLSKSHVNASHIWQKEDN